MRDSDLVATIEPDSLEIRYTPSRSDPRGKLHGFLFTVGLNVVFLCAVFLLPGKHRTPSLWSDLNTHPTNLPLLAFPPVFVALFVWQGFRYGRAAWPSDEIIHCDRLTLTVARVPWLDFSNRTWRTRTFPLAELRAMRFAVIASAKNRSYWGIRFRAHGRRWILPGLEASQAKTLLAAFRELGVDIPDDPKLEKRIKQAREMQMGDTSWMDRSWMENDNHESLSASAEQKVTASAVPNPPQDKTGLNR